MVMHTLLLIRGVVATSRHIRDSSAASELQATGSGQQLLDVWRVDRHTEAAGFAAHSQLDNRKLLWHGTNIAGMHIDVSTFCRGTTGAHMHRT